MTQLEFPSTCEWQNDKSPLQTDHGRQQMSGDWDQLGFTTLQTAQNLLTFPDISSCKCKQFATSGIRGGGRTKCHCSDVWIHFIQYEKMTEWIMSRSQLFGPSSKARLVQYSRNHKFCGHFPDKFLIPRQFQASKFSPQVATLKALKTIHEWSTSNNNTKYLGRQLHNIPHTFNSTKQYCIAERNELPSV